MLLSDAIKRLAAAPIGVHAPCADVIDDNAAAFSCEHQFQPFVSRPNTVYLQNANAECDASSPCAKHNGACPPSVQYRTSFDSAGTLCPPSTSGPS